MTFFVFGYHFRFFFDTLTSSQALYRLLFWTLYTSLWGFFFFFFWLFGLWTWYVSDCLGHGIGMGYHHVIHYIPHIRLTVNEYKRLYSIQPPFLFLIDCDLE